MPAPAFLDLGGVAAADADGEEREVAIRSSADGEALTRRLHAPPKLLELAAQSPGARGVAQLPFAIHWRSSGRARTMGSLTMEFEWRWRGGPAVRHPGGGAESRFGSEISGSGSGSLT
jgi:hypothetical protein